MSPDALLAAAAVQLESAGETSYTTSARAAVLLCRQALEEAVARCVARHGVKWSQIRGSTGFLVVDCLHSGTTGSDAALLWAALSRACHHAGSSLPPTVAEIQGWLSGVAEVVTVLSAVDPRASGGATKPASAPL